MAITAKYASGSGRLEAGEHRVTITKTENMMSQAKEAKDGKEAKLPQPMIKITFENEDEQKHNAYYVKTSKYAMTKLIDLKLACGMTAQDSNDDLLGKKCGILLAAQKPTDDGKVFMEIVGYGKESDVEESKSFDEVPF